MKITLKFYKIFLIKVYYWSIFFLIYGKGISNRQNQTRNQTLSWTLPISNRSGLSHFRAGSGFSDRFTFANRGIQKARTVSSSSIVFPSQILFRSNSDSVRLVDLIFGSAIYSFNSRFPLSIDPSFAFCR